MTLTRDLPRDLPRGLHVLIVEDEPTQAFLVREAMERIGFSTSTVAETAAAAHEALAVGDVDLVILDLGLPDADGLSLLELTRHGDRMGVPVLVVTGESDPARRIKALELGAEDLVVKPFDVLELGVRARRALHLRDDAAAANVVARTLAQELSAMEASLDDRAAAATSALLVALQMRSPRVYARADRVSDLVGRLAAAMDLPELAAQLSHAARSHELGVLALDDRELELLEAGDPLVGHRCEQAAVVLLREHDRLAASAASFRRAASSFDRHIDRLAARMTAVCHTFDTAAVEGDRYEPALGAARLRREDALGLDLDLIDTFLEVCLPQLRARDL